MTDELTAFQEENCLLRREGRLSDSTLDGSKDTQNNGETKPNVAHKSHSLLLPLSQTNNVTLWNSFWLKVSTLLAIAALSFCLLISLVVTFVLSEQRHGLSSPQSRYRYAWTYGPTVGQSFSSDLQGKPFTKVLRSPCWNYMLVVED
ncbi:hypothetical protein H2198_007511 [Neophaeococcomyces mojaviensis]|uniref:Uncharacterized protein n=1 Tax=Neophaeococcomyces mojaviensis TaxID=3383035 RepID=A0ACC2ZZU2_9EURO|nr:hypothetical protein H2198_007511 [Knufia sp. JES_112]